MSFSNVEDPAKGGALVGNPEYNKTLTNFILYWTYTYMNINYKQPQFELFPANSATLEDINKPKFLLANLTLSVESLVIFTILAIMVALFSFSLGVERGKHLAAQALDERVSAAWNVGARTIAP